MRVVVTGASGNVGTSLLQALAADAGGHQIVGLARRLPCSMHRRSPELSVPRVVRLPQAVARTALSASWRLRLQPTPPGWLDMGLGVPFMDTTRAREELDWEPRHSSVPAIRDVLGGIADAQGESTPPLETTRR